MCTSSLYTGCRPSEVAALRWSEVDLERGIVAITKSRDGGSESAPKTPKSRREIELLPNVPEVLQALPGSQGARDDYVFENPEGGPITTTYWPRKSWFPVLKRLGIRRRKVCATRHTFISWALSEGMHAKELAESPGRRSR